MFLHIWISKNSRSLGWSNPTFSVFYCTRPVAVWRGLVKSTLVSPSLEQVMMIKSASTTSTCLCNHFHVFCQVQKGYLEEVIIYGLCENFATNDATTLLYDSFKCFHFKSCLLAIFHLLKWNKVLTPEIIHNDPTILSSPSFGLPNSLNKNKWEVLTVGDFLWTKRTFICALAMCVSYLCKQGINIRNIPPSSQFTGNLYLLWENKEFYL